MASQNLSSKKVSEKFILQGIFCDIRGSKGEKEKEDRREMGVESLRGFKSFRILQQIKPNLTLKFIKNGS